MRIIAFKQIRQQGLTGSVSPPDIDLRHQIKAFHRRIKSSRQVNRAGIINQDIDPAEMLCGFSSGIPQVVLIADIDNQRQSFASRCLYLLCCSIDSAGEFWMSTLRFRCNHDICTVFGGTFCDSQTDAAAAAGYKKGFPFESAHSTSVKKST